MDYKQTIIENAWGGLNMDFGLLHVQLATPVMVAIIILVMIFTLNKLLFQPVLRTLDNRNKIVRESSNSTAKARAEMESLKKDYEVRLIESRRVIQDVFHQSYEEAQARHEELVHDAHVFSEAELERGRGTLQKETADAKAQLSALSDELALITANYLLN
ncbi:MAG: ATP synthase F0 subunit B [SAR324 cluster bacterium]|nr:ATP synthase F0 subunit B [SAR324 cluster bacterium]